MDGRRDVIAPLIGRDLALFGWPRVAIHPSVCVCVFVGNHIEIEFVVFFLSVPGQDRDQSFEGQTARLLRGALQRNRILLRERQVPRTLSFSLGFLPHFFLWLARVRPNYVAIARNETLERE